MQRREKIVRSTWEENIKINREETGYETVDWI
jgi:hypothetical protein